MFGGRGSIRRGSLVVASMGVVLAACGGGGSDASDEPDDTPSDQARSGPPYQVERVDLELVDASRTTPADAFRDLPERPDRTLPTVVLYPDGDGPFPLVVFAHGHSRAVTADAAPLLPIHSAADPTVPVGGSEGVFADAPPPMAFLRYDEGGHDEIFDGGGAQADLTKQAILAFLDDRLRDDPAPWKAFSAEDKAAALGTFEVKG